MACAGPGKAVVWMRRALVLFARIVVGVYLILVAVFAAIMVAGLIDPGTRVVFDRPDPRLDAAYGNGLTEAQRAEYYHLSQGSEILPWPVLTAVEVADPASRKPFVENLSRYGLLPDPGRADGLPVGLTLVRNDYTFGMQFVGVTCAACHVGELAHGDTAVRVDGAPNMLNLQLFYSEAIDAILTTGQSWGKAWRAAKRFGRQDYERYWLAAPLIRPGLLAWYGGNALVHRDKLEARLELVKVIRLAKDLRDPAHPTSGYGRLDAFDGTRNFLLTRLRKEDGPSGFEVNRANMVALDAPAKFPWLWSLKAETPGDLAAYADDPGAFPRSWGFRDFRWIEWTMNTNTVMERNFTETLGAGATVVMDPARDTLFESSIPIPNLHRLEWLTYYMDPPKWPEAAFGPIDAGRAARGAAIFGAECAGCHDYPGDVGRTETGLLALRAWAPGFTGTDARVAERIVCPVGDIGALQVAPTDFTAAQSAMMAGCRGVVPGEPFRGSSFAAVVETAVGEIKAKAYAAAGVDAEGQAAMEDLGRRHAVEWRDTLLVGGPGDGPYAARPLHGIWAAAPYLHNGSVPTLHDLLLPPAQRPAAFALGGRAFDPVKVGFAVASDCDRPDCLVDTTIPGNGNGGHLYGTGLSEPDRMALIEYLKSY